MTRVIIRLFTIYMLICSGLVGHIYLQFYQTSTMLNIIEEETEHKKKDNKKEKEVTKEYLKSEIEFKLAQLNIKQSHTLYLKNWNTHIMEPLLPPPEQS